MKVIKQLKLFLAVASILSCTNNSDEVPNLFIAHDTYTFCASARISVQGSGNYSIAVADPSLAEVSYLDSEKILLVVGNKKGNTHIVIKDNVSQQEKQVQLEILGYEYQSLQLLGTVNISVSADTEEKEQEIAGKIEQDFSITCIISMFALNNGVRLFYLFESEEQFKKGEYVTKGNFEIVDNDTEITPKTYVVFTSDKFNHTYYARESDKLTMNYLKGVLGYLNTRSNAPLYGNLIEDVKHNYVADYPNLTAATQTFSFYFRSRLQLAPPHNLLDF